MNALAASIKRLQAAGFEDPTWMVRRDWKDSTTYQFRGRLGDIVHGFLFEVHDRLAATARFDIEARELQSAEEKLIRLIRDRSPNE